MRTSWLKLTSSFAATIITTERHATNKHKWRGRIKKSKLKFFWVLWGWKSYFIRLRNDVLMFLWVSAVLLLFNLFDFSRRATWRPTVWFWSCDCLLTYTCKNPKAAILFWPWCLKRVFTAVVSRRPPKKNSSLLWATSELFSKRARFPKQMSTRATPFSRTKQFNMGRNKLTWSMLFPDDLMKSSLSDLFPSRSSITRSIGIFPFRQLMYRWQKLSQSSWTWKKIYIKHLDTVTVRLLQDSC